VIRRVNWRKIAISRNDQLSKPEMVWLCKLFGLSPRQLAVPLVDLFPVCEPLGSTMRWEEPPALVQVAVRLATLRQIATFAVA